jgi:hypothetical protein
MGDALPRRPVIPPANPTGSAAGQRFRLAAAAVGDTVSSPPLETSRWRPKACLVIGAFEHFRVLLEERLIECHGRREVTQVTSAGLK